MRLIGYLLVASVALAALKVAVHVVAFTILALLIWFGITRPHDTLNFVGMFVVVGLIGHYPAAGLIVFGALALVALLSKNSLH